MMTCKNENACMMQCEADVDACRRMRNDCMNANCNSANADVQRKCRMECNEKAKRDCMDDISHQMPTEAPTAME